MNAPNEASPPQCGSGELDLMILFDIVWARRWLVVGITVLAALVSGISMYSKEPLYRSSAELLVSADVLTPLKTYLSADEEQVRLGKAGNFRRMTLVRPKIFKKNYVYVSFSGFSKDRKVIYLDAVAGDVDKAVAMAQYGKEFVERFVRDYMPDQVAVLNRIKLQLALLDAQESRLQASSGSGGQMVEAYGILYGKRLELLTAEVGLEERLAQAREVVVLSSPELKGRSAPATAYQPVDRRRRVVVVTLTAFALGVCLAYFLAFCRFVRSRREKTG